jgi:alpha-tubulin suppressor-like RCC1 family protein
VQGLAEPITAIDAGTLHTCAVLASGRVACWGDNSTGQLGASGPSSAAPVLVAGIQDAAEVACGADFTCVRRTHGEVVCWGRLGLDQHAASVVQGLCAKQITAGSSFGCAIDCAGSPVCWGIVPGRPGAGGDADTSLAPAPGATADTLEIRAGYWHVCLRSGAGEVSCWGGNDSGQLGQGKKQSWAQDFLESPAPVKKRWKKASAVCAGGMEFRPDARYRRPSTFAESGQTCVVADSGDVYCWGEPTLDYLPRPMKFRK